jgi:hypothetical protein
MRVEAYGTFSLAPAGRVVIADYDDYNVAVYWGCTGQVAEYAEFYQVLQGAPDLTFESMLWFTPSFITAAQGCQWGMASHLLRITLDRVGFEAILRKAVCATYQPDLYSTIDSWRTLADSSWVRFAWKPDMTPVGQSLPRDVIHVGLYGKSLRHFANGGWINRIDDITDFVRDQSENVHPPFENLQVPVERVYPMYSVEMARWLGVTDSSSS